MTAQPIDYVQCCNDRLNSPSKAAISRPELQPCLAFLRPLPEGWLPKDALPLQ